VVWRNPFEKIIRTQIELSIEQAVGQVKSKFDGLAEIDRLKKEITALEITRDKKVEEFDRREREIEHKVGLERKRQEFEIAQAKRETTVAVKEENLAADKQRFKDEMDFQREHLQKQVDSLNTLVGQLLKRLPTAEIVAKIGNK